MGNSLMEDLSSPGQGPSWGQTGFWKGSERKLSAPPASLPDLPRFSPQLELITTQATKAGFTGGVVVDFPNSAKAKK